METSKEIIKKAWQVELGHMIAEARAERALSQDELARMAGIPQSHLARIETGELNPTIGTIGLLLSAMAKTILIVSPKRHRNGRIQGDVSDVPYFDSPEAFGEYTKKLRAK